MSREPLRQGRERMGLRGRTALITGSCGYGTGASTALRLAREGASIVLNYGTFRHGPEVRDHAEKIAAVVVQLGGRAIIQEADTRDEQQVKRMVEAAEEELGPVDILVNNAGGAWDGGDWTKVDAAKWRSTLAAEIDGAMLTQKHVLPGMRSRKWGRIINMGLQGASQARGAPAPAYCLGKAARAWMTEVIADPHWNKGVTINCIELGETSYLSLEDALRLARGDDPATTVTALVPVTLKKRWTHPWHDHPSPTSFDIAEIVAFLCSDAGRFVTGSLIRLPNLAGK